MASGLPPVDLLDMPERSQHGIPQAELEEQGRFLEGKLRDFGVEGEVVQVLPGPVITMYEYAPASGVKVNKIVNLQDDLALVMRALSVRVVAPIPGKAVVGIEIPNAHRETVRLRDILESGVMETLGSKLSLALGKDIFGKPMVTDLALIPHLLIAGATGSGKSVGLNSMICSLLFRVTPADVRMIMIDPKMLELSIYEGLPHLLIPVVTNPKQAALALRRVVEEMERRYQLLAARGVRSIAQYNQLIDEESAQPAGRIPPGEATQDDEEMASLFPAEKLPYLVVVIDELSDLMMVSSREVEDSLTRIAQMARAAGIHLIVATQRPSVDVLTGVIKANFPARMSFQVTSKTDSRTILDANGAEKLLGRGDMLFLAPGTSKAQRVHSAYVSEAEIHRLVEAWKELDQPNYDESFLVPVDDCPEREEQEYDEKYDEAVALVARTGQASISMLQRRLRVGYNRAARMIEVMESEGVIGPADGVKPREVLMRNTYDDM
jgi:S-DNA-T family DNA segregation ATPase FtsK/SpoIIIE